MSSARIASRISLRNLRPVRAAQHNQKRVGRGQGSGYGGTAGRGANGQKSRSGPGIKPGFEGGQTPITKLFPKRGFVNRNERVWAPINLDRLQHWIDEGRISSSPEKPITARELLLSGCVHNVHDGIKILGDGSQFFRTPIYITPSRASKSAIKAIESKGGKVVCKYYNTLALRDCVKGRTDRTEAAPTRRTDIVWYGRLRNRGYLSPGTLQKVGPLPFVQERWKTLAAELGGWRNEKFEAGSTKRKAKGKKRK
ncbi:ribosomal protein L18e/L15P [Mycena metata]|uniref:Ribosomal protein L18e/L15P n=1 Tax=Mycena metata TaxID=1033252 RepID=A0AAD7JWM9_9AGAR|nr:ribosomal protein L18e/L15P [Mycena metata]